MGRASETAGRRFAKTVWGSELSALATIGQATAANVWQDIAARFELSAAEMRELEHDFSVNDRIDVALISFVRSLRPRYKTALLSNAWPDARELFTHIYKLSDAFDEMVISAEEGVAKPDARIFQIATARLGIAPDETLFIDDWPPNVEGARAFGMQALVLISTEQALAELQQYL